MKRLLFILGLLSLSVPGVAQDTPAAPKPAPSANEASSIDKWGLGLGIGVERYRDTYIEKAAIFGTERTVVTEKEVDAAPSAWLTLNWNIWPYPSAAKRANARRLLAALAVAKETEIAERARAAETARQAVEAAAKMEAAVQKADRTAQDAEAAKKTLAAAADKEAAAKQAIQEAEVVKNALATATKSPAKTVLAAALRRSMDAYAAAEAERTTAAQRVSEATVSAAVAALEKTQWTVQVANATKVADDAEAKSAAAKREVKNAAQAAEAAAGEANDTYKIKYGIFAGLKVLDAEASTFSGFALGPQVSFVLGDKKRVITIGTGWVIHATKTFASGIKEGSPLPAEFTDIKYRESTEHSVMLMFSVQLL